MSWAFLMANTEGYRLVRCPKCLNVLPEPANVTVYMCGGCGTTLRAKIRTSSARHVATKQVRQDSDNYSVATSMSNGKPPQSKDEDSGGVAMDGSCVADAPSTEHDSNGTSSNENGDVRPAEKNVVEVENAEKKDHQFSEDQNANSIEEGPADFTHSNRNGTTLDSGKAKRRDLEQHVENSDASEEGENDDSECRLNASKNNILHSEYHAQEQCAENSEASKERETDDSECHLKSSKNNIQDCENHVQCAENSEASKERENDDSECCLNASKNNIQDSETRAQEQCTDISEVSKEGENDDSECRLNDYGNNVLNSERSKATVIIQDSEHKGTEETEHTVNRKSCLVRVHSRSCDLRASLNSIDFHSARTSLQSKSFRASEPLQSKIMNSVDELKGDLSELFSKPSDCKPRVHPPPRQKQEGYMSRPAMTSSAPLAAYHPAARHSGHATRLSRSGQVAPRGLPSPRYRQRRAYSGYPIDHMEMRPCRHECCHSCQPPCYRSCNHEPAMHKPPVKEIKRRPPPRHHCRPVLRGSPFVICSNCITLVQLPTDFSVPSKGTRRVQCGSCSGILSYSYRDPNRKKQLQSPFGGDDEYSTDDYKIHQAAYDQNAGPGQADPVSYSEEYGLSFGVSYSTSTEDGQPLYVSRNSSFNTVDERMTKDGKLHRLMGYSSASELLRRSPDLFESFDGRTPEARTLDRKGKGVCHDPSEQGSPVKRSKARSGGLPLQGILKRGIHSLESLKLRS